MSDNKNSYAGRLLRVDLTTGAINTQEFGPEFTELFIGGRGVASKILYDEVPPEVEPFDSNNRLIFSPGALHGTGVPSASRTTVATRSPLTNMHGDGHAGAEWGGALKRAGYDVLIIQGRAEKPSYLFIENDHVELRDASELWGMLTSKSHAWLKEETGMKELHTVCIGPAGENRVRLSGIFHNGADKGTSARCGLGAVMGSKNLKAITTCGTKAVSYTHLRAHET